RVTWRVRNRLFLTYFLVGVLPIILIFLFAQLALDLVLSQTTNFLLHEQIDQRIDGVYAQAERRAQAASAKREAVPVNSGETVVLRGGGRSSTSPDTGLIAEFPAWSQPGFRGIVRSTTGKLF